VNAPIKNVALSKKSAAEVAEFAERLLAEDGFKAPKFGERRRSAMPSVQGNWNPFLNPNPREMGLDAHLHGDDSDKN
jgi:hypothetical protein